jgi:hypothetical protein
MNPAIKFVAYLTYIFLHLALPLYSFLRWRMLPFAIQHLQYFLFYGLDGIDLRGVKQTSTALGKVPEHIVFVFDERNNKIGSTPALKRISSLICWAIASGIPYVSIFDSKGTLDLLLFGIMSSFIESLRLRLALLQVCSRRAARN